MLSIELRKETHKFVILDLALQSLQRDYAALENLKMRNVYLPIIDKLIKSIQNDYYNQKRLLAKQKVNILSWEKIDEHFSDLTITTPGEDQVFRYLNMAVKTQVEKLLQERLQFE